MATRPDVAREILSRFRRIAVVGLSDRPESDSHRVARLLIGAGYDVVPVNPRVTEVLGRRSHPSLREVPGGIEVVDVFRRAEFVAPVVDDAIAVGARAVWLQDGIVDEAAARRAEAAGLLVVMDRCMARDYLDFGLGRDEPPPPRKESDPIPE